MTVNTKMNHKQTSDTLLTQVANNVIGPEDGTDFPTCRWPHILY